MPARGMDEGGDLPPAIVVRRLGDAVLAGADGRAVTLLSAPAAASFGGVLHWQALVAAARAECPDTPFVDLLDCGIAPGRALEALRLGQRRLVLAAAPALLASLRARAATVGAVVLDRRPDALDLSPFGRAPAEARRRVARWLDQAGVR